jgi:hypothetical protein
MERHLVATRAELVDFHLVRMAAFVASRDVVLLTADAALQDDVIALRFCHRMSHFFLFAVVILA